MRLGALCSSNTNLRQQPTVWQGIKYAGGGMNTNHGGQDCYSGGADGGEGPMDASTSSIPSSNSDN